MPSNKILGTLFNSPEYILKIALTNLIYNIKYLVIHSYFSQKPSKKGQI